MPADLDPAAQAVWERVLRDQAPGVIQGPHADVLRLYCEAVARYVDYQARLARSGPLLKGARGTEVVKNPLVAMVRDEAVNVRNLARELGLTPSSLSGIHAVRAPDPESMPMELLTRRRII
jgi:P27 family predicted phage terminase small subunit